MEVIEILGVLSIPSLVWGIYLYLQNRKFRRWDAERKIARIETELERMRDRHQQERRELLSACEGEIRNTNNVHSNFLTEEDNEKLSAQYAEHRRQEKELFDEMFYYQKIAGQEPVLLGDENSWLRKFIREVEKYPTSSTVVAALLVGLVPLFIWFAEKDEDIARVSVADVQYELADDNGSVIHRRTWLGNELLSASTSNIKRMILSIKLHNPNKQQLYARVANEDEISSLEYVEEISGDFNNESYLLPADGDTGFIFGIDMTPFTKVTLLSNTDENTQDVRVFNENNEYLTNVQSNFAKVYGMYVPYEIEILNEDSDVIDTLKFRVRCRAVVGDIKAVLSSDLEKVDGKISKSLGFECIPTF